MWPFYCLSSRSSKFLLPPTAAAAKKAPMTIAADFGHILCIYKYIYFLKYIYWLVRNTIGTWIRSSLTANVPQRAGCNSRVNAGFEVKGDSSLIGWHSWIPTPHPPLPPSSLFIGFLAGNPPPSSTPISSLHTVLPTVCVNVSFIDRAQFIAMQTAGALQWRTANNWICNSNKKKKCYHRIPTQL